MKLMLSKLPKTWLIDLDGTIVKHNGYLNGKDELLPGAKEFISKISEDDTIIILTSREERYKEETERILKENGIRYDYIIFGLPVGERILINDEKPRGLKTAHCISLKRDKGMEELDIEISEEL